MTRLSASSLGILLALWLALGACGGDRDESGAAGAGGSSDAAARLVAVPHPDLGGVSEELRAQVAELVARVESRAAAADAESRGQAWGDLARVYHAYGFGDAAAAAYENARALQPDIALWSYAAGLLERGRGRHPAAAERFRRVLEIDPASAVARLHLGESLLELGDVEAARRELEAASRSPAHAAAALAELGRAARDAGDPALALELYQRALEAQPAADLLHHSIAGAHRSLGDETRAHEALARAGALAPTFPDPVATELEELRTTSGALLLRGARALASERPREAVEHYRRAIAADPEDAEARRNLALALRATGDLDGAIVELEHARRLAPLDHVVVFDLGSLHLTRGAHQASADAFASSLALAPEFVPARFGLANAQLLLGRAAEALENLERVLATDPGHQRARYQAAMAKGRLGRGPQAIRDLEAMLEADPGYVTALLGLAELRRETGDLAGARAAFERAAAAGGDAAVAVAAAGAAARVDALLGLASLDQLEGRVDARVEHLSAAAEAAPERDDVREELARTLEAAGRFLDAARERQALVELRPEVVMNRLLEATDWIQAGRSDLARARLEEGVERLPDDPVLANSLARLLATARDDEVRDGRRALEIARGLNSRRPGPDYAETLAMAHAEVGEFEQAVSVQRSLIQQVRSAGQTGHLPRLEENLRRFERGEPLRM